MAVGAPDDGARDVADGRSIGVLAGAGTTELRSRSTTPPAELLDELSADPGLFQLSGRFSITIGRGIAVSRPVHL